MTTSLQHNSRQNFLALFSAVASGQGEINKRDFVNFGYYFFCVFLILPLIFGRCFVFSSPTLSLSLCVLQLSLIYNSKIQTKKKELEQRHLWSKDQKVSWSEMSVALPLLMSILHTDHFFWLSLFSIIYILCCLFCLTIDNNKRSNNMYK